MFKKIINWFGELFFGKARRIAELKKKLEIVEERIRRLEPHALTTPKHVEKLEEVMNDNTRTIHYLLSKNHKVKLEYDYNSGKGKPINRIVSEEGD